MLHFILYALAACYIIGAVWFMVLERKDGFFKWRLLATAFSPLAVPALALAGLFLLGVDVFIKIKDKFF